MVFKFSINRIRVKKIGSKKTLNNYKYTSANKEHFIILKLLFWMGIKVQLCSGIFFHQYPIVTFSSQTYAYFWWWGFMKLGHCCLSTNRWNTNVICIVFFLAKIRVVNLIHFLKRNNTIDRISPYFLFQTFIFQQHAN
jgi:hypothetical protein